MPDFVIDLSPPDLGLPATLLLLGSSMCSAFITATMGAGGGLLLLGLMTLFMPPANVIAVHGVIQLGSNAGRAALLRQYIRQGVFLAFLGGAVVGAGAGSQIVGAMPEAWFRLTLGVFVLWACWMPMPRIYEGSVTTLAIGGAVTSALTLFVGATGPFVATFLRSLGLEPMTQVGTFSACMTAQHALKVLIFALAGFAFADYLPFMTAMVAMGFVGNCLGRTVLARLPTRGFRWGLSLVLTALALRQVYAGMIALST